MTRVKKVYGDGSQSAAQMNNELTALGKNFEALSNRYGIAQSDVINLAADWAAAGSSGVALAKATKLTIETMILGEMDAKSATTALIAIQAQYGLAVDDNKKGTIDLTKVIALLNNVENQTGTSLQDLITVMSKSAGAARDAGIDVLHLAAFTAALVPAAGTAANAGNALKTIITRLIAPTKAAAGVMKDMGIDTTSMAWQSKNGTDRLLTMATAFEKLSSNQKDFVSKQVAGVYQISRFDVLMKALVSDSSYYAKAIKAGGNETANYVQAQKELNMVLDSNPQKLKIIGATLQNSLASVIQPLLPTIIMLANSIAAAVRAFSNLNPQVQHFVLIGLLVLAMIGPVTRYIGSLATLVGILGEAIIFVVSGPFKVLGEGLRIFGSIIGTVISFGAKIVGVLRVIGAAIFTGLSWPWMLAAAAIVAAIIGIVSAVKSGGGGVTNFLHKLWGNISSAFSPVVKFFNQAGVDIAKAFNALPQSIQNAMMQVIKIVAWAAMEVYKLFSYLNPFAHHSPSLVEVVTWGMQEISAQYASVANIGSAFKKAASDLAAFKKQMGNAGLVGDGFGDNAKEIAKMFPKELPGFQALRNDLAELNKLLDSQKAKVDAQQKVVDAWSNKLDAANAALETQQKLLDGLQSKLDALNNQYAADQQAVSDFANAPIQGMQQFTDEIFANSEAQKKIQLQMLQWQDVNGSIDDISSKMSSLAGDLEKLKGEAKGLQQAGAGSDVLNPINSQIDQMQAAYNALQKTGQNSPMSALQQQLDALQNQGQELQLASDIKFDPLTKQIQDLANAQKELPFDQIIAGIKAEQADMATLTPQIDAATAAVDKQTGVVAAATAARDAIQARYDAESKALDKLKDQYDQIGNAISDVTNQLQAMSSAASAASSSAASSAAGIPAGANFPDVGGTGSLGREGTSLDQSSQIDDLTKQLSDAAGKALGNFGDMFKPIKDGWNKTWAWIKTNVGPVMGDLGKAIQAGFTGIGVLMEEIGKSEFAGHVKNAFGGAAHAVGTVIDTIRGLFKLLWPDIKKIFDDIVTFVKQLWTKVGPSVMRLVNALKPIAEILGVVLVGAAKILASVISHVLGPILNWLIHTITDILDVISGLINFVVDVFTGKWSKAWNDVKQVLSAVWDEIKTIWDTGIGLIIGAVKGFIDGVVGFFQWLYDVLVGHSIIPDLMNEIVGWFEWLIAPVQAAWEALWAAISWVWDNVAEPAFALIEAYIKLWAGIFTWVWNNIIKPVWNALWAGVKAVWNTIGKPLFDAIQTQIKGWAAIFGWLWNNVIKPAWNALWGAVKTVWNDVGVPIFNAIKSVVTGIGTVFHDLIAVVTTAWNAVWNAIKATWDKLGKNIFNGIADGFVTIVNAAIHAINAIIHGINAVSSILHLGFSIGTIDTVPTPKFAVGGYLPQTKVGGGFKTNGARAIVGEGGQYPEFVIPTDPRYRKRAQALWAQTGRSIQMLSIGGSTEGSSGTQGPGSTPIGNTNYPRGTVSASQIAADIKLAKDYNTHVWSDSRSVADQISDDVMGAIAVIGGVIADTAMKAVMIPVKAAADTFFNSVPVEVVKKMGLSFDNTMYNKMTDIAKNKDSGNSTDPVGRWAPVAAEAVLKRHFGGDQNGGNMKRALKDAAANVPDILARLAKESGGDPNAINNYDSNAAAGTPSKGLMQVIDPTYQSYRSPFGEGSIWDPRANMWAALGYAQSRYGSIGAGMNQPGGYYMGGILPAFQNGGIAKQATAGIFGEAGKEILAPLTPLWKRFDQLDAKVESLYGSKGGDTTINISGTFSFPNIKSGDDASDLIDNLKGLAGK